MSLLLRALLALLWFVLACLYGLADALVRGRDLSSGHRFSQVLSWGCLRILGLPVEIRGLEHLTAHQPCVYVANHQSHLDALFYGRVYPPRTLLIGKKEVLWIPFFGIMFAAMGNLLIDRKNRDAALAQMEKALGAMRDREASIWVFPEGSRAPGKEMLPFKKGAFRLAIASGRPLVPMVMEPLGRRLDARRWFLAPGPLRLRILEPVDPTPYPPERVDELIAEVRARMEAARAEWL